MVSVKFDYDHKRGECNACCQETTVEKYPIEEWDEKTDDWTMIWLCIGCVNFIKHCSFCTKPTINWWGRYNMETVQILRKTGKTVCEDCCEHVMAATTSVFATVDTRPGHYHSSKMSDAEYNDAWLEGHYDSYCEWVVLGDYYSCNTLYYDLVKVFYYNSYQEDECVDAEEAFYEKYERQQSKKSAKGAKAAKADPKLASHQAKKGNKKLNRVGKPSSTADSVAFDTIWDYALMTDLVPEVIPETPRGALQRMDVPDKAFSTLDMVMEIRIVWTLDRPFTMTIDVPVPACLLKRRQPLEATEFGALMVAVWKAYRGCGTDAECERARSRHGRGGRFLDWPDRHICNFRKSNIFIDFVAKPIEC